MAQWGRPVSWTWPAGKSAHPVPSHTVGGALLLRGGIHTCIVGSHSEWGGVCQQRYLQILTVGLRSVVWFGTTGIGPDGLRLHKTLPEPAFSMSSQRPHIYFLMTWLASQNNPTLPGEVSSQVLNCSSSRCWEYLLSQVQCPPVLAAYLHFRKGL